jgi:hypothetical protein
MDSQGSGKGRLGPGLVQERLSRVGGLRHNPHALWRFASGALIGPQGGFGERTAMELDGTAGGISTLHFAG